MPKIFAMSNRYHWYQTGMEAQCVDKFDHDLGQGGDSVPGDELPWALFDVIESIQLHVVPLDELCEPWEPRTSDQE